jgi:glycyl-tRNA synthetase beta chain
MVGEFPELQGEMGRHYARYAGEHAAVAEAIGEHYAPRFAGDAIPRSPTGQVVGIADRADTLVGIFAAGLKPTGNKDPFALRRAALGLLRILLEAGFDVPPREVLMLAADSLGGTRTIDDALLDDLHAFVVERLRHHYGGQGFATDLVNAALASPWTTLPDLERRLRSIDAFMDDPAARSLAASNKRIGNILRKAAFEEKPEIDTNLFDFDEEKLLFEEVTRIDSAVQPLLAGGDYGASLRLLSGLEQPVNRFFDAVMVMDEDAARRENRLALLARLKGLFDRIADLSILG